MKSFIVLCAVVSAAFASPYSQCSPAAGQIAAVKVKDCSDDVNTCILQRGTDAAIEIDFTSTVNADSVLVKAYGIIGGIPLPYPLNNNNACQNSGITCPVKAGTPIKYAQSFKVEKFYPAIGLEVKWSLVNANGEELVCIMIPVKIQ